MFPVLGNAVQANEKVLKVMEVVDANTINQTTTTLKMHETVVVVETVNAVVTMQW